MTDKKDPRIHRQVSARPLEALSCLALVLALCVPAAVEGAETRDLLLPVSASARALAAATTLPPAALRANAVTIDRSVLGDLAPGATVRLALFEDRKPTVVFDHKDDYPGYGHVWVGHVEDVPHSEVYVSVVEDTVTLALRSRRKPFVQLLPVDGSTSVVFESELPMGTEFCPGGQPPPETAGIALAQFGGPPAASSHDTYVDVAAFYTDLARIAAGGTNAIRGVVLNSFSQANLGHQNSASKTRLRIVWLSEVAAPFGEDPFSPGTEDGDLGDHLNCLRGNRGATCLPDARALGAQFGADLLALFVNDQGYNGGTGTIGLAGRPGRNSATAWYFAVNVTFVHEIGHNLGLCHNIENSPTCPADGAFPDLPSSHAFHLYLEGPSIFCSDDCSWKSIMWASIASDIVNYFSDPNLVLTCPHDLCSDSTGFFGSASADNTGVLRVHRSKSSVHTQPVLFGAPLTLFNLGGQGTLLSHQGSLALTLGWHFLTEANPALNTEVLLAPGNYVEPVYPLSISGNELTLRKSPYSPAGDVRIGLN